MQISIPTLLRFLWYFMHKKCKYLIVSVVYDLCLIQFHKIIYIYIYIYISYIRYFVCYLLFILIKLKMKQDKSCQSSNFVCYNFQSTFQIEISVIRIILVILSSTVQLNIAKKFLGASQHSSKPQVYCDSSFDCVIFKSCHSLKAPRSGL